MSLICEMVRTEKACEAEISYGHRTSRSFDARAGGKIQKRTGDLPVFKERRSRYQWRKYRNIVKLQEC